MVTTRILQIFLQPETTVRTLSVTLETSGTEPIFSVNVQTMTFYFVVMDTLTRVALLHRGLVLQLTILSHLANKTMNSHFSPFEYCYVRFLVLIRMYSR